MAARCGRSARQSATAVKRRLLIAAIFLLAGAVVNVAVAWACALAIDVHDGRILTTVSVDSRFSPTHWRCPGAIRVLTWSTNVVEDKGSVMGANWFAYIGQVIELFSFTAAGDQDLRVLELPRWVAHSPPPQHGFDFPANNAARRIEIGDHRIRRAQCSVERLGIGGVL